MKKKFLFETLIEVDREDKESAEERIREILIDTAYHCEAPLIEFMEGGINSCTDFVELAANGFWKDTESLTNDAIDLLNRLRNK